ncbi:helix-turn-helix transcriptional regulator [Caballeronia sp. LZ001]|uniref:helix-turn-helix domain-containing protein n=1 Tax=Caballeronia sp. LZ001 TaxID=3038553 RepID=UPI00285DFD5D|nr:helix-turn-helix transcriptional regulator [Caballeronia sp. LZ001]MDR5803432.1 helix-turn-helix transcriptional regulator [Caballeronia sp. LZ001]
MHNFFVRLKEERERLGMSQQGIADACGVSLRSQQNYEKGERSPDAEYLAALTTVGADVIYVLTGKRPESSVSTLSPRAKALLDNYEHSSEEARRAMDQMGGVLAKQSCCPSKSVANGS